MHTTNKPITTTKLIFTKSFSKIKENDQDFYSDDVTLNQTMTEW